jgi:hypothetical protein
LAEEARSNSRINLMGEGLINKVDITEITKELNSMKEQGEGVARVTQELKNIGATAKDSTIDTEALKEKLKALGMEDDEAKKITSSFKDLVAGSADVKVAIEDATAQVNNFNRTKAISVAKTLAPGLDTESKAFTNLVGQIEQYITNVSNAKIKDDELTTSLNNGAEAAKNYGNSIYQTGEKTKSAGQLFGAATSGLMSLGMAMSSIKGLMDTIKNPDASGWEKFAQVLTSVSMIMMSLTGVVNGFKAAKELLSLSTLKETGITILNAIAKKELAK